MPNPYVVLSLRDVKSYEIERPSEFALWTQFEVHCDKCHRIWLHTSPGEYYHQRTGAPHYFVSKVAGGSATSEILTIVL